ncbi:MAG: V-type ATP synthase subunit A [Candidatus Altiarchaeota archaeon]
MGTVERAYGPVVVAKGMTDAKIYDLVRIGELNLMAEVIRLKADVATLQVYEDTSGIKPGDMVQTTGNPLSVELGPGLIGSIYDGLQRPLRELAEKTGRFIGRGISARALDSRRRWEFKPVLKPGDKVSYGTIVGTVQETGMIEHRIMARSAGTVKDIRAGSFTIDEPVATLAGGQAETEILMRQSSSVRDPRPAAKRLNPELPLHTGQRVIDTFFPIAKGGTVAIPGPFGSGKTVTQHSLAKFSDTDIVIFVGCGERGNEMAEVLTEFPKLVDPKTDKPLMERTILIANTSNMPVAAREASIYTGATMAEYYRDMGYDVALMVDSTSRWAEAMREVSSRMEEMPAEEGYPAYLGRRLAEFYSRAGRVRCQSPQDRYGSVTIIGAVSPPGGDISEPVSQSTLRVTKVFLALDAGLAHRRHFPAINWLKSYSLYNESLEHWFDENVAADYTAMRTRAIALLQKESELLDIVKLVAQDTLPESEQEVLKVASMLREDFLQQNSFEPAEAHTSYLKQHLMLKAILEFHELAKKALGKGIPLERIMGLKAVADMASMKRIPENRAQEIKGQINDMHQAFGQLAGGPDD